MPLFQVMRLPTYCDFWREKQKKGRTGGAHKAKGEDAEVEEALNTKNLLVITDFAISPVSRSVEPL